MKESRGVTAYKGHTGHLPGRFPETVAGWKAALLAAIVVAACSFHSTAQPVYSQNTYGIIAVTIPPGGFVCVGNQLNFPSNGNRSNTLDNLFGDLPNNTTKAWAYDPVAVQFTSYTKRAAGWAGAAGISFDPGTGFLIQNLASTNIVATFQGDVPAGTNVITINPGFNLISKPFPVGGLIETKLGLNVLNGDK